MEERKLVDFVQFTTGINQTRVENKFRNKKISFYGQSDFEHDIVQQVESNDESRYVPGFPEFSLQVGDVVINNATQQASIVGQKNAGKVISLNFTKVIFKDKKLDRNYFVYLFNSYNDLQRQKERESQGNGRILRITRKALGQLIIPVVPLDEQKKIGLAYIKTLELQKKMDQYTSLLKTMSDTVLTNSIKGEQKNE